MPINAPIDGNHHKGLLVADAITGIPFAVEGISDDGSINVNITGALLPITSTLANVTMTGSSVTLQAANADRKGLYIFNDSGGTIQVKLGTTASATSFTVEMVNQAYYELPQPVYTGVVTALGASGDVRVTEVS